MQGRLQQRVAAGAVEPDHHVLQHRHGVKQADILEGAGDPGVHHLVGLQPSATCPPGDAAAGGFIVGGNDVKQGRFARAVRADKAKDLRLVNMEADVVDGPQAAELHGDVLHLQDNVIFRHSCCSFFPICQISFFPQRPLAGEEHDNQQQQGEDHHSQARVRAEIVTEELQRLIEEAQPLAAADHQHGAEQGAGGAAEPAEDDNNQQLEGEHKVEQPWGNGGQQGSQQTAADPSEEGAGGEGAGFNAEGVDPHGDRRIFIVANSFHHPAILRPHQLEDHAGGQQGEQPAPEQEMRLLRNIVQPDGAVGDLRVVNGEDLDDKPKAEGDNGQVVATYPEDRHGEAHRQRRRAQAAYQQGREGSPRAG